MQLQEAIERFLSDTQRRRSEVTVKRYGEAMELLQSYLALELLDPDVPDEEPRRVDDVTPEVIHSFITDFLGKRLMSNDRARKRYVAATRSFTQWLSRSDLISEPKGQEILEVLRRATKGLSGAGNGRPDADDESQDGDAEELPDDGELRYYQIVEATDEGLLLLDLRSADEVRAAAPRGEPVESGDLVAGVLTRRGNRPFVTGVRVIASEDEVDDEELGLGYWDDDDDDFFDDDWSVTSGPAVEDALEILASEDRYAPREVVRVILTDIDTARDELMDWLTDDDYRNEPFPGAGEAPANAARLLSEVRDEDALPRLLDVLGATDPLGEEAPLAVARFGRAAVGTLTDLVRGPDEKPGRRTAALWALAFAAARNPTLRVEVGETLLGVLLEAPQELAAEALTAMEELRLVELTDRVLAASAAGDLNFEALDWTAELFEGRLRAEGWGERVAEALLPVLYLYPTGEELEEFYESLEEDLGDLWELVGMDEDDEDDDDELDPDDDDDDDSPPGGGKVIPFRRPRG